MTENTIITDLENKFRSQANNVEFLSTIYDFLYYHKDPNWNLKDVALIGVGEIVQSNNKLIHGSLDTLNYLDDNHNVLILQNNKNQSTCCMIIPPSSTNRNQTNDVFFFGHPVFDEIDTEFSNVGEWLLENEYDEQIQIVPYGFKRPYNLYEILPTKLRNANDVICAAIANDEELDLSTVASKSISKSVSYKH